MAVVPVWMGCALWDYGGVVPVKRILIKGKRGKLPVNVQQFKWCPKHRRRLTWSDKYGWYCSLPNCPVFRSLLHADVRIDEEQPPPTPPRRRKGPSVLITFID
jgi:hypothetical protein